MIKGHKEGYKEFINFSTLAKGNDDKCKATTYKRKSPPLRTRLLRKVHKNEETSLIPIESNSKKLPFVPQVHRYFPRRSPLHDEIIPLRLTNKTPQIAVPSLYRRVVLGMLADSPLSKDKSLSRTQDILLKSKGSSFEAFVNLSKTSI